MNKLSIEAIRSTLINLYDSLDAYDDAFRILSYSVNHYGGYFYLQPNEWLANQNLTKEDLVEQLIIYLEEVSMLPANAFPVFMVEGETLVMHTPFVKRKHVLLLTDAKCENALLRDLGCFLAGLANTECEGGHYLVKFTREGEGGKYTFDSDICYFSDDAIPLSDLGEEKDNNDGTSSISFMVTMKEHYPMVLLFSELMDKLIAHNIYQTKELDTISKHNPNKPSWVNHVRLASEVVRTFFTF